MSLVWFENISRERGIYGKRKNSEPVSYIRRKNIRHTPVSQIFQSSSSGTTYHSPYIVGSRNLAPSTQILHKNTLNAYIIQETEMLAFFDLLEDSTIKKFLSFDSCYRLADNFSIACVFAYFKRCNLTIEEYNRMNFFCCLFLVHDIEEDEEDYKYEILPWALGSLWRNKSSFFSRQKEALWARMNYRAVVSYRCCTELMSIFPSHSVWSRNRLPHHGGAIRYNMNPPNPDVSQGPKSLPRLCDECKLFYSKEGIPQDIILDENLSATDSSPNFNDSAFHSHFENDSSGNTWDKSDLSTYTRSHSLFTCADESWLSQETYCHDKVTSVVERRCAFLDEE
ncbi:unnamed protein product [Heterobilharzia americana]|nr:unnamed protein product [Heterobilharzia americana]CAH8453638.1 unnamed protein product [Heterobilharzia americana]